MALFRQPRSRSGDVCSYRCHRSSSRIGAHGRPFEPGLGRTARPNHWVHNRSPFLCASAVAGAVRENNGSIRGAKQVVRAPPERSRGGKPVRCMPFATRTAVLQANSLPVGQPLMRIKCADSHLSPSDRSNEVTLHTQKMLRSRSSHARPRSRSRDLQASSE